MNDEEKDVNQPRGLACEDCGKSGPDVGETFCPYAEEIHDKIVEAVLCKSCYHERCMEI